jgi:hypothetical protein
MRPVHTLHLYQPEDRFRHRRNLRQLPQVMCLAMQPRQYAAFVGATRGTRVAMRPVHTLHLYQPDDRFAIVATSGNPPQTNPVHAIGVPCNASATPLSCADFCDARPPCAACFV